MRPRAWPALRLSLVASYTRLVQCWTCAWPWACRSVLILWVKQQTSSSMPHELPLWQAAVLHWVRLCWAGLVKCVGVCLQAFHTKSLLSGSNSNPQALSLVSSQSRQNPILG